MGQMEKQIAIKKLPALTFLGQKNASKRAWLHKPSKSGVLIHFIALIRLLGIVRRYWDQTNGENRGDSGAFVQIRHFILILEFCTKPPKNCFEFKKLTVD